MSIVRPAVRWLRPPVIARAAICVLLATAAAPAARAQSPSAARIHSPAPATPGEARAVRAFAVAKANQAKALALEAFLAKMPKGADLHMHLSGAVYAETLLQDAAADNWCVDEKTLSLVPNAGNESAACPPGTVPAAGAFKDQKLYDALVDSFSMRSFVPTPGWSGHDQFFATFDRFDPTHDWGVVHGGEWLDEVATRAAAQNEQYLEVMYSPNLAAALGLVAGVDWPRAPVTTDQFHQNTTGSSRADLAAYLGRISAGLAKAAQANRAEFDSIMDQRNRIEHCGRPDAAAACSVKIRLLYQVLRENPPQVVFAQTVLAFELARTDPNVVGLNFVQPEDSYLAMSEYSRQMHMLDYLHSVYPSVHITLHAGELAPGLVPPEGLRFHIREAVELGHAERIGHGVDILYETDPYALLREMADRHVMVEINLTSNDVILGVVPPYHPLPMYLAAHVPVALSTDDEGVSRIDLTHEYVRAAMQYGLGYLDFKTMARTSLEHSFLPGVSLWQKPDIFAQVKPACAGQPLGGASPAATCREFLQSSQKAAQQWELERRFDVFESNLQ